jgi:hypothetical protein
VRGAPSRFLHVTSISPVRVGIQANLLAISARRTSDDEMVYNLRIKGNGAAVGAPSDYVIVRFKSIFLNTEGREAIQINSISGGRGCSGCSAWL